MSEMTPRFGWPLLAAGQAQKELFHNEALLLAEALLQPVAQTLGDDAPPPAPQPGQSWIVGPAPAGAWAGAAGALATWTEGGWRFAGPVEGMAAWVADVGLPARYRGGTWRLGAVAASSLAISGKQVVGARLPAIPEPAGGTAPDAAARATLAAILVALRTHGLIES